MSKLDAMTALELAEKFLNMDKFELAQELLQLEYQAEKRGTEDTVKIFVKDATETV